MPTKRQAPCSTQSQKQVEAYYRNVKPGDIAVIRETRGHFLKYTIDKIADTNPKRGKIYLEQGDPWGGRAWYAKSGKPMMSPGGQAHLVVPTDDVLAWIKEHEGKLPTSTLDVDCDIIPPGRREEGYKPRMTAREILLEMSKKRPVRP